MQLRSSPLVSTPGDKKATSYLENLVLNYAYPCSIFWLTKGGKIFKQQSSVTCAALTACDDLIHQKKPCWVEVSVHLLSELVLFSSYDLVLVSFNHIHMYIIHI